MDRHKAADYITIVSVSAQYCRLWQSAKSIGAFTSETPTASR